MTGERRPERAAKTPRSAVRGKRDRRRAPDGTAREREELDRRLDDALACTFPASDPFDLTPRKRPRDESD